MIRSNPLVRRLLFYAALAAGLFGALLALGGAVIFTLAGHAPSPLELVAIVGGAALAFALAARIAIPRIAWFGVATLVKRATLRRRP